MSDELNLVSSRTMPSLERVPGKHVGAKASRMQGAEPWPDDNRLVELMAELGSFSKVAESQGKRRESLRDYLRIRPGLLTRMEAARPAPIGRAESRRRWRQRNPEYRRAARRRWMRGKRLRGAGPTLAFDILIREDPCSYCGDRSDTADHIEPQAHGGSDEWENLTGACRSCNDRKGDKPLLRFLLEGVMP